MRNGPVRARWLVALLASAAATAAAQEQTPAVKKAMQEMWRRGTCLLSSVYNPAAKEAAVPGDVKDTPVVEPRVRARRGELTCYAIDGTTLWAADDQALYRIDAATGRLVATFDRAAGLPDAAIQSLAAAGGSVWLATRGQLARLDVKAGRVAAVEGVEVGMGRLAAGPEDVWLVGDRGAYRLAKGEDAWRKLPEFPGQEQLAAAIGRGFWTAEWHSRMRVLLPTAFATGDGLYVVCGNRLGRFDPAAGKWSEIATAVWQAIPRGRTVWALATDGVVRYDAESGQAQRYKAGEGPAPGRAVGMAAGEKAFLLASQADYDDKANRFTGGGLSRLDLASGAWSVTEEIDGTDVRFATAVTAEGDEAWATCVLYDRVEQRGAHPGMAHVKQWRPHAAGLGLLHFADGQWALRKREGLKTERRWVMGQKGTVKPDRIGPETVEDICRVGDSLWGVYRIVPEQYYAGYFISAGCLARKASDTWQERFDVRTDELGLAGEQPELMLISHSHGHRIVLADGHAIVLGAERVAGRAAFVTEAGVFLHDAAGDRFTPALREADRLYWRATAAAADEGCVWFGGDAGTVSRLDRKTGRLELVGVVPGRKIEAVSVSDGKVLVRTARGDAVLPVSLASAPKLPEADVLVFDGRDWAAGRADVKRPGLPWTLARRSNYLLRDDKRAAFLKGVFRPLVLCEDPVEKRLWLGTYAGVASIPLP